jgi:hypothetical protein
MIVPKFLPNPEPGWGPKARAGGKPAKRKQPEVVDNDNNDDGDDTTTSGMDSTMDEEISTTNSDLTSDEASRTLAAGLKAKSLANQGSKKRGRTALAKRHQKRPIPCRKFNEPTGCPFGDSCKYLHAAPSSVAASSPKSSRLSSSSSRAPSAASAPL